MTKDNLGYTRKRIDYNTNPPGKATKGRLKVVLLLSFWVSYTIPKKFCMPESQLLCHYSLIITIKVSCNGSQNGQKMSEAKTSE